MKAISKHKWREKIDYVPLVWRLVMSASLIATEFLGDLLCCPKIEFLQQKSASPHMNILLVESKAKCKTSNTWGKTSGGCCLSAATIERLAQTATSSHPKRPAKRTGRAGQVSFPSPPGSGPSGARPPSAPSRRRPHSTTRSPSSLQLTRIGRVSSSPGICRSCFQGSAHCTGCRSRRLPIRRCTPR